MERRRWRRVGQKGGNIITYVNLQKVIANIKRSREFFIDLKRTI